MHTIISSLSRGLSIKIDLLQKRLKWAERLFFRHSKKKKTQKHKERTKKNHVITSTGNATVFIRDS